MNTLRTMGISTWCITLKSTPKREEYVKSHLASHNIDFKIFYGIDAIKAGITATVIQEQKYSILDTWVTIGAVGCYLSHYMLWQNIMDSDSDMFFIVEDDVSLIDNFTNKLTEYFTYVPSNWDIIYVGHESLHSVNPIIINDKVSRGIPACTYAYIIKKETIPMLLELAPIDMPVDTLIRLKLGDRINSYAFTPKLATQKSSVVEKIKDDEHFKSLTYDWTLNPNNAIFDGHHNDS